MAIKRKKESKLKTFTETSHLSLNFYEEQGFVHHRLMSNPYVKLTKEAFRYYSKNFKPKSVAFRNSEGKPRHIVDIFRDKESPALSIFLDEEVQKILNFYLISNRTYIYTHSKMSFKQPLGKERSDWSPHQDNGYKNKGDIRDGFAVFLCLEDMHKSNGALQVFPESHKLGRLKHIKISENSKYGDHQYSVHKIPNNLKPYIIEAKQGDIIIFHSNLIHQSTSSLSNSILTPECKLELLPGLIVLSMSIRFVSKIFKYVSLLVISAKKLTKLFVYSFKFKSISYFENK